MPTVLTAVQNRFLRGQAHDLKAMLQVGGKGVTDAVVAEVSGALEHHELIKVKVAAEDREARDAIIAELATRTDAALVQRIGHVAILYRPNPEQRRIVLPRSREYGIGNGESLTQGQKPGTSAVTIPDSRFPNPGTMQLTLERPDYDYFLRGADGTS